MADDELMNILEESDAESELTESGEDHGEVSEEEEGDQKPLQGEWSSSSVQDPLKEPLDGGGFEGRSNAMLLKQEIFDQNAGDFKVKQEIFQNGTVLLCNNSVIF